MVTIQRDSGYADRVRAYKVVLDGDVVGEIRNGQKLELDVAPGQHEMHLKIDWCRSNSVDFIVDGDLVEFECGSSLRGRKLLLALLYVSVRRSQYIWLRRVDPPEPVTPRLKSA